MGKKTLTVAPAAWSEASEHWLAPACAHLDNVRSEVLRGAAHLFIIGCDGEQCGAVVLRVDNFETHTEGVIVAAGGHAPGVSLLRELLPVIEKKFSNARRIRIHTRRRGMMRQLARAGYELQEMVLSKPFTPIPQQQQQQQGGGGGGGSSSSSSTNQTANIDKRLVVDSGTGVTADNSTVSVSVLDGGAVERALAFSRDSLAGAGYYGQLALESGADITKLALAQSDKSAQYGIDLSKMTVDRVLDIADTVFAGAFGTIDKNAQLIERAGGFVDKAYADAKGSGAERYYVAVGVVAAVVIVAVYANNR